ncbi:type II toxin-antitoxin system RelE family toxin [Kordiimonas sp.]|uniref:type II toxin-antitoxin system RelE family toxin n=1 Tax=Kordiimonas sp. TaxID=1970157 RepID=UPI003A8E0428
MQTIEVVISPAAERDLRKLNPRALKAVAKAIDQLEQNLRPRGVEKIQGHPGFYRIRAGDFRVIYYPMTGDRIAVLVVADRKDAYRGVGNLDERLRSVG